MNLTVRAHLGAVLEIPTALGSDGAIRHPVLIPVLSEGLELRQLGAQTTAIGPVDAAAGGAGGGKTKLSFRLHRQLEQQLTGDRDSIPTISNLAAPVNQSEKNRVFSGGCGRTKNHGARSRLGTSRLICSMSLRPPTT